MVRFSVLSKARKEGGGGAKPASSSSSSSPLLCLLLLLGWGEGQIAPTSCVILRSCSDPLYLKVSISALMRLLNYDLSMRLINDVIRNLIVIFKKLGVMGKLSSEIQNMGKMGLRTSSDRQGKRGGKHGIVERTILHCSLLTRSVFCHSRSFLPSGLSFCHISPFCAIRNWVRRGTLGFVFPCCQNRGSQNPTKIALRHVMGSVVLHFSSMEKL
ncbi:uncharacterized protein LOC107983057 isoform X1 [Anolis carolinensis]|uniref:uncharacterized protein LOC107983057 isoform X1 n=1 Tax=Anolis carolinensis TaxID=28377 RepID=UPI002F2B70F3